MDNPFRKLYFQTLLDVRCLFVRWALFIRNSREVLSAQQRALTGIEFSCFFYQDKTHTAYFCDDKHSSNCIQIQRFEFPRAIQVLFNGMSQRCTPPFESTLLLVRWALFIRNSQEEPPFAFESGSCYSDALTLLRLLSTAVGIQFVS